MKLLLVNQYFWPDVAATAQLLSDLAVDAVNAQMEVSVLTGRGSYTGGRKEPRKPREHWCGVEIRRVWCTNFGRGSVLGRVTDYATFLASTTLAILMGRRQDVVVCLSTPPLLACLGVLAKLRGSQFVYKVEDLYPDVAVALGVLPKRSVVTKFFAALSAFVMRRAAVCVALDGVMKKTLLERGAQRVEVIPNWADGEAIQPDEEAGKRFRIDKGLGDELICLYSGNLGLAHRFDAVIESIENSNWDGTQVTFLFVGGGPRLLEVREALSGRPGVRFLPYQPRELLQDLYNAADLHLVTLREEVAGMLVPSKYSGALAAGKPVLLVGGTGTDMFREIQSEGIGWACHHDAGEIEAAIREALADSDGRAGMGKHARRVFEERYDRSRSSRQWMELLLDVKQP